jgi:hypothetical protein
MLDLVLSKGKRFRLSGGLLDVSMHTKATAQGVPLSHLSWHLPSVHMNWPVSRCIHYDRCCTDVFGYRAAVRELFTKIVSADPGHPSLGMLLTNHRFGTVVRGKGNGKQGRGSKCSRLVLPYHPALAKVTSRLRKLWPDFEKHNWHDLVPTVAWSLAAPSIHRRILSDCRRKLSVRVE